MARIRTIKPSFFTSLTIAELSLEQRLTFIGLWTHVDDEGRCVAEPRLIKAALWALDDRTSEDVSGDLDALTNHSLIALYQHSGRRYLAINGWEEHQVINRPAESKIPSPSDPQSVPLTCGDSTFSEESVRTHGLITEDSSTEGKGTGNREQGREGISCASGDAPDGPERFDEFWETYDKKRGKKAAMQKWRLALKKPGITADLLIEAAAEYVSCQKREKKHPTYTKDPATWLNGEHWNDEPQTPKSPGRSLPSSHDLEEPPDGLTPAEYNDWYADMIKRRRERNAS